MQETARELAHLLLKSVPTIIFFLGLIAYLNYIFFRPMKRMLEERKQSTEGVRELARQAFEAAERKNSEFEQALQIARAELHREREVLHRRWAAEQVEQIAKARAEADARIEQAKHETDEEVRRAQAELESRVQSLGEDIVHALLARRAA
ncbi:MAG TPA: ATP synthase F0 subunit B [Bryobacteraceae bacterium]